MCRLHEQHCRLRWCGSGLPLHAVSKLHETAVGTAACLWGVGRAPPDFPYTPPIGRAYEQRGRSDRHHPSACRRPRTLARGQNGSVFLPEHTTHRAGIRTEKEERQAHPPACRKLRIAAQGQNGGQRVIGFCRRSSLIRSPPAGCASRFVTDPEFLVGQGGIVDLLRPAQSTCFRAALIMEPAQGVPRSDC